MKRDFISDFIGEAQFKLNAKHTVTLWVFSEMKWGLSLQPGVGSIWTELGRGSSAVRHPGCLPAWRTLAKRQLSPISQLLPQTL